MTRSSRPFAPIALAAALSLAACADDPAPAEDPVENTAVNDVEVPAPAPAPVAPPTAVNVVEAAPAPEIEPEQQVLDDADATGMTARVDRSGETAGDVPPDETGQPAEAQ